MRKILFGAGTCTLAFALGSALFAQSAAGPKLNDQAEQLQHGKYLVEEVAMCGDCHTPFNEQGHPVKEKHLQGAMLMFKPIFPVPGWVDKSANIAGLKGWSDAQAITFLTTGVDPNGKMPGPPMPRYRFKETDAAAILVYLRSLDSAPAESASK